jgi:hypothetical protein
MGSKFDAPLQSGINRAKVGFSEQPGREIGRKGKSTLKSNLPVFATPVPFAFCEATRLPKPVIHSSRKASRGGGSFRSNPCG